MFQSQFEKLVTDAPHKESDRYCIVADGKVKGFCQTERGANRKMNNLVITGKYATVEWRLI
jgi:hypothetical protein